MIGHVQGGWEFIWAAYFLSWVGIAVFGASLVPAGPRQLPIRELICGAMLVFTEWWWQGCRAAPGLPSLTARS